MTWVARISISPVKGFRLSHPEAVELGPDGVAENRRFFLIGPDGERLRQARRTLHGTALGPLGEEPHADRHETDSDGEDARDFDDAVFAQPDPDHPGGWRILVAIADVAWYVRPDKPPDRAAEAVEPEISTSRPATSSTL